MWTVWAEAVPGQILRLKSYLVSRLFLNVVALAGAALGVANVALAWHVFGVGGTGDQWMLAIAVSQSFVLLSQLGVEQVAVFSAAAHARSAEEGERFDRDSLTWGLMSGGAFALLVWLSLPLVVQAFAQGFMTDTRQALQASLAPLLLQVALAPALYVLRQQLLLRERAGWSVLLGQAFSAVQCLALASALLVTDATPSSLAWAVGAGSAAVVLFSLLALGAPGAGRHLVQWTPLLPFIRASVALRLTHSAHNFLVVMITNAALSSGSAGTVALFQYVKRMADGLCAVSVGPHLGVYHAAQAIAWARRDRRAFVAHIWSYMRSALLLLALAASVFLVGAWFLAGHLPGGPAPTVDAVILFVLLVAWQSLIAVETVPAGVLALDNRAGAMLFVNGVYIAAFYAGVHGLAHGANTGTTVAALSLACQLLSLALFSRIGWRLHQRHFQVGAHA